MIRVKLKELLEEKDIKLQTLSMKTEITYSTLHRFINNKTTSVSYDILDKICSALDCELSDIIEYTKDEKNSPN